MEVLNIKQGTSVFTSEGLKFYTVTYLKTGEHSPKTTNFYAVDELSAYMLMQERSRDLKF